MNIQGIVKTQFAGTEINQLSATSFPGATALGPVFVTYTGTLPTYEDIVAAEPAYLSWLQTQADARATAQNRKAAQQLRDNTINSDISVLGAVWQVDEKARENIRVAIDYAVRNGFEAENRGWIMADNSIRISTITDLRSVMDAYTQRMDSIFGQYAVWAAGDMLTAFVVV